MSIKTKIQLHDGSTLVVNGNPEQIWHQRQEDEPLRVDLLGGGTAVLPVDNVYMMCPYRRPAPVMAAPEPRA